MPYLALQGTDACGETVAAVQATFLQLVCLFYEALGYVNENRR